MNKKAMTPVVAITLLFVTSVISVVAFQNWFGTYSSGLFSEAELKSNNLVGTSGIDNFIDNTVYFKNTKNSNLTINSIKVGGIDCDISKEILIGVTEIPIFNCLLGQEAGKKEIVIVTDESVLSETFYYDTAITVSLWNKTYDYIGETDFAKSLLVLDDGGFMLFGYADINSNFQVTDYDMWLIRINYEGEVLWNKTYGNIGTNEYGKNVLELSDGNFALFGSKNNDFWLMKIDKNGNEIWNYTYNSGNSDDLVDSLVLQDNNIVLYGSYNSEIWVIKVDNNGKELWNKTYSKVSNSNYAGEIIRTNDNKLALFGSTLTGGLNSFWLLKIDDNGNELWNKTYANLWDEGKSIVQTIDNGFALLGSTEFENNFWLVKTNSTGGEQWNKTFDYEGQSDIGESIISLSDGSLVLFGIAANSANSNNYYWLIKTNNTGGEIWNQSYLGKGKVVKNLNDGGFILLSLSSSGDYFAIRTNNLGKSS